MHAAGVVIKAKSEPVRLEKAITLCKKRLNLLEETLRTDDNKAIREEMTQLQQLFAALQQASVDAGAPQVAVGRSANIITDGSLFCLLNCRQSCGRGLGYAAPGVAAATG